MYEEKWQHVGGGIVMCEGEVRITVEEAVAPFILHLRIPRWTAKDRKSYYTVHENVKAGDIFEFTLPMTFKTTLYTGGEEIPHKQR